ncbi:hypothetical protein X798_04972 [Onchocerca flexuosa]|uniref:Uncharacterized protein n=1 Tax=Onchocerca flexuosa TaxID=387005 RepID=A0A238BSX3_9BILA|nr:hypothetical protein X798_04972 [Onchocerca flexuosa]
MLFILWDSGCVEARQSEERRFCKCEGGSIDMRYTHAIIVRVPNSLKMEKKTKIDLSLAEKQLEELCETLREAGVDIIELSPEEHCLQHNLFTGDAAICINGTALITRPKKNGIGFMYGASDCLISNLLNQLAWQVIETPQASEHNKEVVLEGSDVLYTGKEVVARTFSDLAVIPITLPGNQPLRHYVSLISTDVLTVGSSKEAKQRMERQATFRYKTLTVKNDDAVNCLNVNDYVIYRQDTPDAKFQILHEPIQMVGITADELAKIGSPISRLVPCLLRHNPVPYINPIILTLTFHCTLYIPILLRSRELSLNFSTALYFPTDYTFPSHFGMCNERKNIGQWNDEQIKYPYSFYEKPITSCSYSLNIFISLQSKKQMENYKTHYGTFR